MDTMPHSFKHNKMQLQKQTLSIPLLQMRVQRTNKMQFNRSRQFRQRLKQKFYQLRSIGI